MDDSSERQRQLCAPEGRKLRNTSSVDSELSARSLRLEGEAALPLHDGMELVYIHKGLLAVSLEARLLEVREGELALFWAAIPRVQTGTDSPVATVVEIPLERFMGWRLPGALNQRLLGGRPSWGLAGDVQGMAALKWEDDLASEDHFVRRAAELEVQAAVLRMARQSAEWSGAAGAVEPWRRGVEFILSRLDQELSAESVAREIGLHPTHAMRVFRQRTGFTIGGFVLRHRLARAKRLLLTTGLSVGEVGMASGFGSERRFFEAFRESEGCTPGAYCKKHGPGARGGPGQ